MIGSSVAVVGMPISTRCGSGRGGDVDEAFQQLVERGLAVVDGGAFVVGEGDVREHPLKVVLGLQQLALGGAFGV